MVHWSTRTIQLQWVWGFATRECKRLWQLCCFSRKWPQKDFIKFFSQHKCFGTNFKFLLGNAFFAPPFNHLGYVVQVFTSHFFSSIITCMIIWCFCSKFTRSLLHTHISFRSNFFLQPCVDQVRVCDPIAQLVGARFDNEDNFSWGSLKVLS
jgi:hypothetical protein